MKTPKTNSREERKAHKQTNVTWNEWEKKKKEKKKNISRRFFLALTKSVSVPFNKGISSLFGFVSMVENMHIDIIHFYLKSERSKSIMNLWYFVFFFRFRFLLLSRILIQFSWLMNWWLSDYAAVYIFNLWPGPIAEWATYRASERVWWAYLEWFFLFVVVFVIHKVLRLREIKSEKHKKTSTNLSFYVSHHLLLSFIIVINIKKWLTY